MKTRVAKTPDGLTMPLWRRRAIGISMALASAATFCQVGCSVCYNARRTTITEPSEFSWKHDRGRSLKAYRQWADEAWGREGGACPDGVGAGDYELGFRDGFVDYVYAGGDGEPPPVPPRKFWNVAWRTPAGAAGAEQWFAGYRHGAQSARDGGYRQSGVVHSSYASGGSRWGEAEAPPAYAGGAIGGESVMGEKIVEPGESLPAPLEPSSDAIAPDTSEYDLQILPTPPSPDLPAPDQNDEAFPGDGSPLTTPPAEAPPADATELQPSISTPAAESAVARFRRAVSTAPNPETSKSQ